MDSIVKALPTDLLWVAVALVVLQQLLANSDKIGAMLSGRASVERITRHVPDLLERQQKLKDAGHDNLAWLIRVQINGVIYPQAFRVFNKQVHREVKRHQSWWTRQAPTFVLVTYLGVLLFVYYEMLVITAVLLAGQEEQATWSGGLISLAIVVAAVLLTMFLHRSYMKTQNHFQGRDSEDYKRAMAKWRKENDLVPQPQTERTDEPSTQSDGAPSTGR